MSTEPTAHPADAERGGVPLAGLRWPWAGLVSLASTATAWPAAGYGALVIGVAGDLHATGTLWIFGWPFLVLLAVATVLHQLAFGAGARWGIPAMFPGVQALDRAVRLGDAALDRATLTAALPAVVRFPGWNAATGLVLALLVTVGCAVCEHIAAAPRPGNTWVILRGGLYATALYTAASVALTELLTRPAARRLRRIAADLGLEPYDGYVVRRGWRIAAMVAPTVVALLVAAEITPVTGGRGAHAALVLLSALVAVGLNWLHDENSRGALRELGAACRELAAGRESRLITGSVEAPLLDMAREFNAAASRVGADRQAARDRYLALFERAGDAILLADPETGLVISANARAERLFGHGAGGLRARPYFALFDDETRRRHPALASTGDAVAEAFLADGEAVRADGSSCPVDISISTLPIGGQWLFQAIVRDVSERRRIESALRRSVRRLEELYRLALVLGGRPVELAEHVVRALAELLDVPIAIVERLDGDEIVVVAMLEDGVLMREVRFGAAGTPCADVRTERQHCVVTDAAARFPDDRYLTSRGIQTYAGVPILDRHGEVIGIVNVMDRAARTVRDEDVQLLYTFARRMSTAFDEEDSARERDELSRLLAEQNSALRAAQERLIESDRAKSEFVGMMSHELRTPLNVLLGYTEMLLETEAEGHVLPADERRSILERMFTRGRALADLVEDTLSVLRLEAGAAPPLFDTVVLADLFHDLEATDRPLRQPARVTERWIVDPDLPPLTTDRRKLRQVISNLVGNARKFTDAGEIEVHAAWDVAADIVRIRVSDTGCGISADHVPFIFDLYRQAPTERAADGCGLGLYIVRRYVEMLGGRVACTSTPGEGTTFTIELPVGLAASRAAGAILSSLAGRPPQRSERVSG
jgi:PAS domain S-box-containing protein